MADATRTYALLQRRYTLEANLLDDDIARLQRYLQNTVSAIEENHQHVAELDVSMRSVLAANWIDPSQYSQLLGYRQDVVAGLERLIQQQSQLDNQIAERQQQRVSLMLKCRLTERKQHQLRQQARRDQETKMQHQVDERGLALQSVSGGY